jgi:hypothetical protein
MAQSKAIKRILPVDEPIDISRDQITFNFADDGELQEM